MILGLHKVNIYENLSNVGYYQVEKTVIQKQRAHLELETNVINHALLFGVWILVSLQS